MNNKNNLLITMPISEHNEILNVLELSKNSSFHQKLLNHYLIHKIISFLKRFFFIQYFFEII